jgi:hypothetical protein
MTLFHRRSVFAFVLGATLAAAVLVGRSAFATTETISACFKPSNGTLYLLGESSGRHECQPGDIPISWNTAGVNGQDGLSVTSESLAPGDDPACPNGGSKFTGASGVTYACNGSNGANGHDGRDGVDGQDGQDGVDGQDGEDFAGTFTSPLGRYSLVVNDTTAKIEGPTGSVQISDGNIQIQTSGQFSALSTGTNILNGSQIWLGGPSCGVLRSIDVTVVQGGVPVISNPAGSPKVRAC